jgi:hypothetical protein
MNAGGGDQEVATQLAALGYRASQRFEVNFHFNLAVADIHARAGAALELWVCG